MALAGIAGRLGRALDLHDPDHLGQLLNAIAVLGTGVIVLFLARALWPARPVTWLAAVGFSTSFSDRAQDGGDVPSGAARDARHSCSTAGSGADDQRERGRIRGCSPFLSGSCSGWVSWSAPGRCGWLRWRWSFWGRRRGHGPSRGAARAGKRCDRPVAVAALRSRPVVHPPGDALLESGLRSPAGGHVRAREAVARLLRGRAASPEVVRRPWQGAFNDRLIPPVLYAESWGDYFGIWAWGTRSQRKDGCDRCLVARSTERSWASCRPSPPSSGLVALLGLSISRPSDDPTLLVATLPPIAAGPDPSSIWPSRIRRATETRSKARTRWPRSRHWHCASASRLDGIARRRSVGIVLGAVLVVSALATLPFLFW